VPLYEYQCPNDGVFDQMQKFSDPPLTACPKCGAPVEKLVSAPAIQFKGSGWYITDYARKSSGGSESAKDKGTSSDSKDSKATGSASGASGSGGSTTGSGSGRTAGGDKKS